jgi:glycogen debranching enzyme
MDTLEAAYREARRVLHACIDPLGLKASALSDGYPQVWARDSMITLLGAILLDDEEIRAALRHSLETLGEHQAESGCIPSNVVVADQRTDFRAYMDGNAWYLIGHRLYFQATRDRAFLERHWPRIRRTCEWLLFQDVYHCGLLAMQEAADWMDHLAVRGRGLYSNAVAHRGLAAAAELAAGFDREAAGRYARASEEIRSAMQKLLWVDVDHELQKTDFLNEEYDILAGYRHSLVRERPYFLPYIGFRTIGHWFDTLGNLLAVLFDIADRRQSELILDYIDEVGVHAPYPAKALYPVILPGDRDWRDYYLNRNLNLPHHYHNGGIWPFIGGFYVAALVKLGRLEAAERELTRLAEANRLGKTREWEFNEWLHGETGRPMGRELQAWSAGMYLYARESLRCGRPLHF